MHSGLGENQLNRADRTNKMRYSRTVLIGGMTPFQPSSFCARLKGKSGKRKKNLQNGLGWALPSPSPPPPGSTAARPATIGDLTAGASPFR